MTENSNYESNSNLDEALIKGMDDFELETEIGTKIKKSEDQENKQPVVVVKKSEKAPTESRKFIFKENENNLELDDNLFIIEGTVTEIYETPNKALSYVKLIVEKQNGRNKINNFPQVKVFKKYKSILKNVAKGDYIRIRGQIMPSLRKKAGTEEFAIQSSFVAQQIKKIEKPMMRKDPFYDKFGIATSSAYQRKNNQVILSGTITNITVKNPHCMIVRVNCVMKRGIVPILFSYYAEDFSNDLKYLYQGSRIGIIGEIRTSKRRGKTDMEYIYFQDINALQIGATKEY